MKQPEIFIIAVCISLGVASGWMLSDWFRQKPVCPACPAVNYAEISRIAEKAVKAHAVQPFEVEKMKNIRGFTYSPQSVYMVQMCQDTLLLKDFVRQVMAETQIPPPKRKSLFR
jgi:hypothetical protein